MARSKTYVIPFAGLSSGLHEFEFEAGDKFFEDFEYSEIKKARVIVHVGLHKQSTMLILDFTMTGSVHVMCDRCSDMFDQPIEGRSQLIVKFGQGYSEEDDIVTIPHSDSELNIAQFLYEYISLIVPSKRTHEKTADCNQQVLKKLEKLAAVEKEKTDSRWAKLKGLKVTKQLKRK